MGIYSKDYGLLYYGNSNKIPYAQQEDFTVGLLSLWPASLGAAGVAVSPLL